MDDEVTDDEGLLESSSRQITYGEFFNEWFPFYLSVGMTFEQYWDQDSALVIPYFRAYMLKRDEKNYFAWLTGFYVYYGHSVALSNFGAGLAGKKGKEEYMKEPAQIRPKTEEEKEAAAEAKRKKIVAALNRFHARMEAKQNAEQ